MGKMWIRADGGPGIGAGHLMRCLSVSLAAQNAGVDVSFLVSNQWSAQFLASSGVKCAHLDGDSFVLGLDDANRILKHARPHDAVLVDSYAVSDAFFDGLSGNGLRIAYIDDRYLFAGGALECPRFWNVDFIIDYGFSADKCSYEDVYAGSRTGLLLGPRYAPVRQVFSESRLHRKQCSTNRVLISCGSTNPKLALEKMVEGCLAGCDLHLDVVIGALAEFNEELFSTNRITVHRGVRNLAPFMERSAFAISAAGMTLYELSCVGVPTIACSIVDNQTGNTNGFRALGLGVSLNNDWKVADVKSAVASLVEDKTVLDRIHSAMIETVDGHGAERIVKVLTKWDVL